MSEQRMQNRGPNFNERQMSTKIKDLPSEVQTNISELEEEIMQKEQDYNYVEPNQSNIKVDIKKKVRFTGVDTEEETGTIWNKLRSEINEENALLLLVLLLSTSSSVDKYASSIPYIGGYYNNGNNSVFKALMLLCIFILLKVFLLPRLSI